MQKSYKIMGKEENSERKIVYAVCFLILAVSLFGIFLFKGESATGLAVFEQKSLIEQIAPVNTVEVAENITKETALDGLMNSEIIIKEMTESGISTSLVKDFLLSSKRFFFGESTDWLKKEIKAEEDIKKKEYLQVLLIVAEKTPVYEIEKQDFKESYKLVQNIINTRDQAYQLKDTILLLDETNQKYVDTRIDTEKAVVLLEKGKISFKEERYNEAAGILKEASDEFEKAFTEYKRKKGLIDISKNFFVKYWVHIIIAILVIAVVSYPVFIKVRKMRLRIKLETLKSETKVITKLLKKAQSDCFKDKKITKDTYDIRADRYKKRLAEISHTIPVIEAQIKGKKMVKKEKPNRLGVLEVKR